MLNDLRIRNFRALRALDVDRLAPINVLAGKNNSGKTTLLEALFLLCGAGNPSLALNVNVIRGFDPTGGSTLPETFWKPLFNNLDMTGIVEIEAAHDSLGQLTLSISSERPTTVELPLNGPDGSAATVVSSETALLFSFRKHAGELVEGRVRLVGGGLQVERPAAAPLPFEAVFLSSHGGNAREDAMRLGQLRTRKMGVPVVEALRIVEPRLQSIEDNTASGVPMIWGDIGLSELVPLPVMGEGMTRIARLILAISVAPGGIVLVDEIENGLHHTALEKVWRAVDTAARRFNTQVVASTHSYECLETAQRTLAPDRLAVRRLENGGDGIRCVTYGAEAIKAAIAHGLEVR